MEFFASIASALAVPRSFGQIYGILYASSEPLTFSDIVARLSISKGSVSQGLTLLRSLGAVNEVDRPSKGGDGQWSANGTRAYGMAFEPELSLRRLISGVLRDRVAPLATESAERLERLRAIASACETSDRKHQLAQAKRLVTWRRQLKSVLPILTMLLGPKGPQRTKID